MQGFAFQNILQEANRELRVTHHPNHKGHDVIVITCFYKHVAALT